MLKSRFSIPIHRRIVPLAVRICLLGLAVAAMLSPGRTAQAEDGSGLWTPPVNLSNSGSATNPILVKDSGGGLHLIWEDKSAGYFASEQKNGVWTAPALVQFPWSPPAGTKFSLDAPVPVLAADLKGNILAFWIDSLGALWHSHVKASGFADSTQWTSRTSLSDSALMVAAAVDSQNLFHLVYIRPTETSQSKAGIYYLRSADGGATWSNTVPLYASGYLRGTTRDQANISISAGFANNRSIVYIAWDNRPIKRVFMLRSADSGSSWDPIKEIDGPTSSSAGSTPSNITVGASGKNAELVWQTGQSGSTCRQMSQGSSDGGSTWAGRQGMLSDVAGCPSANQFIEDAGTPILLASIVSDQVYLQAWDGQKWSQPQLQNGLYSFINLATYSAVNFSCRQFLMSGSNQLVSVGCDASQAGDIWLTTRTLDSVAGWYQPGSTWSSSPAPVMDSQYPIADVNVVSDGEGAASAMWVQPDPLNPDTSVIFYSALDGGTWSTPGQVLKTLTGNVYDLSVALGPENRLLAVWCGGPTGRIYFSRANAPQAMNADEWAAPLPLPSVQPVGSSPEVAVDSSGTIFVIYAIPFNENRGIYLVTSSDGGVSWSQPAVIFDAASAGWSQVGSPHLSLSPGGAILALWDQLPLPGTGGPMAVYSAGSSDRGNTWSAPNEIVESSVVWDKVLAGSGQTFYLAWMEKSRDQYSLRFKVTADGGQSWGSPAAISNTQGAPGAVAFLQDADARLHIVQVSTNGTTAPILDHWTWDGTGWSVQDQLEITDGSTLQNASLGAAVSAHGALNALFPVQIVNPASAKNVYEFRFSSLTMQLQNSQPASTPPPAPPAAVGSPAVAAPVPAPRVEMPTPAPSPTALPTFVPVPSGPGLSSGLLSSTYGGLAVGALFAALVVAAGLGAVWVARRKRLE